MLSQCDAALIIGDKHCCSKPTLERSARQKIDLGEVWKLMTGLPFVYAFWAGPPGALTGDDVAALQSARDAGMAQPERIAQEYFADSPEHHAIGAQYLRDNIKYHLGETERAGLETFYRYAVEAGVRDRVRLRPSLRFYHMP